MGSWRLGGSEQVESRRVGKQAGRDTEGTRRKSIPLAGWKKTQR